MHRVALITSGGDGAGINSMIEMLARYEGIDLYGFHDGYDGILVNQPIHLTQTHCANHSLDGAHFLRTARSKLPFTKDGRQKIIQSLVEQEFECLIVCGGSGSQIAAKQIHEEGMNTLFIPMTVDNDVIGTDYTIGYDTALNHILNIIANIQNTATNMPGRIFMVEVLGGNVGNLALESALAGGCDLAIIPEYSSNREQIAKKVQAKLREKQSLIITCSESAYDSKDYQAGDQGVSFSIADSIEHLTGIRVRKTVVGFYIRAGHPSNRDAIIASKLGYFTAATIFSKDFGKMIAIKKDAVITVDYKELDFSASTTNQENIDIAKNLNLLNS
ncbi:6-phosphofructokinase [Oceanobacillus jeddahense]|uniref:6-phosphofructokinase n=1 Tax=Oceanobacillus jeddahense TaxID=1462527 RepID=UPI00362ACC35